MSFSSTQTPTLISSTSTLLPLKTTPATVAAVLAARKTSTDELMVGSSSLNGEIDFQRSAQLSNASLATQPTAPSYNSVTAGTYSTTSTLQQPSTTLQAALPVRTVANPLLYNLTSSVVASSQQLNNGLITPATIPTATTNNIEETLNLPPQQQLINNNICSGTVTNLTGYNKNELNQNTLMQVLKLNQNPERNTLPQTVIIFIKNI